MRPLTTYKYFLVVLFFFFSACSSQSTTNNSELIESRSAPPSETTLVPTTIIPTITADLNETLQPMSTNESEIVLRNECPVSAKSDASPLWSSGSILFASGQVDNSFHVLFGAEHANILAVSANGPDLKLAYEIPAGQGFRVIISDDGTKLLRFEQPDPESLEKYPVIYDLVSQEEKHGIQTSSLNVYDWLPDGRVKYLVDFERIFGVEERYEFLTIDPMTQNSEMTVEELELPGYQFYEEPFYTGIASIDPTSQLVLYTLISDQGTADVALRNRETESIIWQQRGVFSTHGYPYPNPDWDVNGSRVLFSMPVSEAGHDYFKFFSLTRDGQVEQLPSQPFPFADEQPVRELSRSPSGRYIFYSLRQSPVTGSGFIVDTLTSRIGEICDPETTFLDGEWVTENQFVYRVLLEEGGQSLRVLDIPTWTMQELANSSANTGFAIFGWTPIEFP